MPDYVPACTFLGELAPLVGPNPGSAQVCSHSPRRGESFSEEEEEEETEKHTVTLFDPRAPTTCH